MTTTMKTTLHFKYKGDRNYIQGPDIINNTLRFLNSKEIKIDSLEFSFHKLVNTELVLSVSEYINETSSNLSALPLYGKIRSGNKRYLLVYEESPRKITKRESYNEDLIFKNTKIQKSQKQANYTKNCVFENLEIIVAMNKLLLSTIFKPFNGKWYFVKLDTQTDLSQIKPKEIEIKMTKNIGMRIVQSSIIFDSIEIGQILFSLK